MRVISVIDTSICDYNLGNQIIMEAVYHVLNDLFPQDFFVKLQYLEKYGKISKRYMKISDLIFFGGTNSLSSEMNKYSQMGFSLLDLIYAKNKLVLLSVGWWQYQPPPNLYTRILLKNLLHKDYFHIVRDSYTAEMLRKVGILNVYNGSCVTTWNLTPEHCAQIPHVKSENVVMTLTDYNKSPSDDFRLLEILVKHYKKVYIWIQGLGDMNYFKELIKDLREEEKNRIIVIPPKLYAYDEILANVELDYIGTRLHGGIRALQFKKRTLIIGIDNRAIEMHKDINLNVVKRGDTQSVINFIEGKYITELNIPFDVINKWKAQFK